MKFIQPKAVLVVNIQDRPDVRRWASQADQSAVRQSIVRLRGMRS